MDWETGSGELFGSLKTQQFADSKQLAYAVAYAKWS
jgi:hypothetical protein